MPPVDAARFDSPDPVAAAHYKCELASASLRAQQAAFFARSKLSVRTQCVTARTSKIGRLMQAQSDCGPRRPSAMTPLRETGLRVHLGRNITYLGRRRAETLSAQGQL